MLVELKISALLQTAETDINIVMVLYHVTDEASQVLLWWIVFSCSNEITSNRHYSQQPQLLR